LEWWNATAHNHAAHSTLFIYTVLLLIKQFSVLSPHTSSSNYHKIKTFMSILSITAPRFTVEDELSEKETYTREEVEAARIDLYGQQNSQRIRAEQSKNSNVAMSSADSDEDGTDEEIDESIFKEFYNALGALEPEEKDAFLEASHRVPNLVETESPPIDFLRAEQFNSWAAAERCINYWELRVWLFGERAWLPMTSTGNGCLDEADCTLLETGFCTLLPEGTDRSGRGVLCFQVFERKLEYHRMAIVRVIFYLMSIAHERKSVQKNGLVIIADVNNYTTSRFDRKFIKCVAYLFMGYHPATTKAYHMCAPPGKKSCFLLVLPFIRYFQTRHIRQRFLVHTGTAPEVAMDLEQYGINTERLPLCLGGKTTMESFCKFLEERRAIEMEREAIFVRAMENRL
jgi:hypothetical protein